MTTSNVSQERPVTRAISSSLPRRAHAERPAAVFYQPVYEIPEVMNTLRLSRQGVYNLINEGKLSTFMVGRRRFVSGEALAQFIRSRELQGAA